MTDIPPITLDADFPTLLPTWTNPAAIASAQVVGAVASASPLRAAIDYTGTGELVIEWWVGSNDTGSNKRLDGTGMLHTLDWCDVGKFVALRVALGSLEYWSGWYGPIKDGGR